MITYAVPVKNAMLTALATALDAADPEPGRLRLYSADQPEAGVEVGDQVLLADIALNLPCGTVADGVLTLSCPIADELLPASGTPAWARLVDGAGEWVADGDVGLTDSGALIELNSLTVYQGGIVRINAAALAA